MSVLAIFYYIFFENFISFHILTGMVGSYGASLPMLRLIARAFDRSYLRAKYILLTIFKMLLVVYHFSSFKFLQCSFTVFEFWSNTFQLMYSIRLFFRYVLISFPFLLFSQRQLNIINKNLPALFKVIFSVYARRPCLGIMIFWHVFKS